MANLTEASRELFRRPPDERFECLSDLFQHCQDVKEHSHSSKQASTALRPLVDDGHLGLCLNGARAYRLNDWSFTQLCAFGGAAKDTVNRLCPETAARVLTETLADRVSGEHHVHALIAGDVTIRSINGPQYRRLWNADVVTMLIEFAMGFEPPPKGFNGATGLHAGEQDLFCFMIDPNGWIEIGSEAFAPGFFVWNSEVGKRSVGISTFWFQAVCQNHIVWDATEIVEMTRRHVGNVNESLGAIRRIIEDLVRKRDTRKDQFATVIGNAMRAILGPTAPDVEDSLTRLGFTKILAKRATELAREKGSFTIWAVVDALTQLARDLPFAGARADADQKASSLLALMG